MKTVSSNSPSGRTWLAILCIPVVVVLSEAAAWWWMHPHAADDRVEALSYRFPDQQPGHVRKALADGAAKALKCDSSEVGHIQLEGGRKVEVSFFEWNGTDQQGLMQAFGHSPDVCMGVAGYEVEEILPSRSLQVGGQNLVFDVTRFRDQNGDPFYIFKAPWAEGTWGLNLLRDGPQGRDFRRFKFEAVKQRWKPRVARVLMAGVSGCRHEEDGWKLLGETVLKDLRIEKMNADIHN